MFLFFCINTYIIDEGKKTGNKNHNFLFFSIEKKRTAKIGLCLRETLGFDTLAVYYPEVSADLWQVWSSPPDQLSINRS